MITKLQSMGPKHSSAEVQSGLEAVVSCSVFQKLEKHSAFLWCKVDYAEDTHVLIYIYICIEYEPT